MPRWYHFKFKPSELGIVFALAGVIGAISQILLVGPAIQFLGSHRAVVLAATAVLSVWSLEAQLWKIIWVLLSGMERIKN